MKSFCSPGTNISLSSHKLTKAYGIIKRVECFGVAHVHFGDYPVEIQKRYSPLNSVASMVLFKYVDCMHLLKKQFIEKTTTIYQ